jgi:RNA polymerase sigma-70 factor (ECF subfamily)
MEGFDAFVAAHYEGVRRALSLALSDPGRAEDLAQEGFAQAWRRWGTVAEMERPVAWVYVVALNKGRRALGRERRLPTMAAPAMPRDLAGGVTTSVALRSALESLAPRQRAAVVLRYLADLTVAEVARAMGCADGTVKSTLHAALNHLRVELAEEQSL